jgi:hypothetical protein
LIDYIHLKLYIMKTSVIFSMLAFAADAYAVATLRSTNV